MTINRKVLPIKAHYFLFMAAMGPILPFVVVVAKQFGISEIMFGTINAFLPLLYFLAKPLYGYLIDYFNKIQMIIYTASLFIMGFCFFLMYLPSQIANNNCDQLCKEQFDENGTMYLLCNLNCINVTNENSTTNGNNCSVVWEANCSELLSRNHYEYSTWESMYSIKFIVFVSFMCMGLVLFNICNSITDAICFNILGKGNEALYGAQRVWGSLGYGTTAFIAGYLIDKYSGNSRIKDHTAAFVIFGICIVVDIVICFKLKPTKLDRPVNIIKSTLKVINNWKIGMFMLITFIFGVCDGFAIYYLYWFIEDMAVVTNMNSITRFLEGMITLIQTFFGEVLFFQFSGRIIEKIGYDISFILCFFAYFLRFILISVVSNVWLMLPIEAILQGLSYALSYTLIVSFTSRISTPGIEATMQSVVTAVYDCIGYAVGSFVGGILYKKYGGRITFFLFSMLSLFCCISFLMIILFSRLFKKSFGLVQLVSFKVNNDTTNNENNEGLEHLNVVSTNR